MPRRSHRSSRRENPAPQQAPDEGADLGSNAAMAEELEAWVPTEDFYGGAVIPATLAGLERAPVDPGEADDASGGGVLRALQHVGDAPDVRQVLHRVGLSTAREERAEVASAPVPDRIADQLYGVLTEELEAHGFAAEGARLTYGGADFDAEVPHLQGVLALLDTQGDGDVDRDDVVALARRDASLGALLDQVAAEAARTADAQAAERSLAEQVEAAERWASSQRGPGFFRDYQANWRHAGENVRESMVRDAHQHVGFYLGEVLEQHASALDALAAQRGSTETTDALPALLDGVEALLVGALEGHYADFVPQSGEIEQMAEAMGRVPLHVTLVERGTGTPESLWLHPGQAFYAELQHDAEEHAAAARPYAVEELVVGIDALEEEGLAQMLSFAYDVHLALGMMSPELTERVDDLLGRHGRALAGLTLQGEALSANEFRHMAEYFRLGSTPAMARTMGLDAYSTQTTDGTAQRAFDLGSAEGSNVNAEEGGRLSSLGYAGASQIARLRDAQRDNPFARQQAMVEAGGANTVDTVLVRSADPRIHGLTLRAACDVLYGLEAELRSVVHFYTRAEVGAYDVSEAVGPLNDFRRQETTLSNIDAQLRMLDGVRARIDELAGGQRFLRVEVDAEKIQQRCQALHAAMSRRGTDEYAISDALMDLSEAERWHVETMYARDYGVPLRSHLLGELEDAELEEALAWLDGNNTLAMALRLENTTDWLDDDEDRALATMRTVIASHPEAAEELEALWLSDEELSGDDARIRTALDTLAGELDGTDAGRFDALMVGDTATADALALMDALGTDGWAFSPGNWTEDEDAVFDILSRGDARHRQRVADVYEERTGSSLHTHIESLFDEVEQDVANAASSGDKAALGAARLNRAALGAGTDEEVITGVYAGQSASDRHDVDGAFETYEETWTGSQPLAVQNMFEHEADGHAEFFTWEYYRVDGEQNKGLALYIAMEGIGTDVDVLRSTLTDLQAQDLRRVFSDFREWANMLGGVTLGASQEDRDLLEEWLYDDVGGRDLQQLLWLLTGRPETLREKLDDAERRYEYERGEGATGASRAFMAVGELGSGEGLDRVELLEEHYQALQALVDEEGNLRDGVTMAEFDHAYRRVLGSVDEYQQAKTALAGALKTGAEISAALIVTILTDGAAAPWLVAVLSGVASAATGIAVTALVEGQAYSDEAIATDAIVGAFAAVLGGATAAETAFAGLLDDLVEGLGSEAAREIVKKALENGITGGLTAEFQALMSEATWRQEIGPFLATVYGDGLRGFGQGLGSGLAGQSVGQAFGERQGLSRAMRQVLMAQTAGLTGLALDPSFWSKSPGEIEDLLLSKVLSAVASGLATAASDELTADRRDLRDRTVAAERAAERAHRMLLTGRHPHDIPLYRDMYHQGFLNGDDMEMLHVFGTASVSTAAGQAEEPVG